jgi:hypothetical protein
VEVSLPAPLVAEATPARSATAAARRGTSRVRALRLGAYILSSLLSPPPSPFFILWLSFRPPVLTICLRPFLLTRPPVAPQAATPPATATAVLSAAVRSTVEAVAEGRRATRVAVSAI